MDQVLKMIERLEVVIATSQEGNKAAATDMFNNLLRDISGRESGGQSGPTSRSGSSAAAGIPTESSTASRAGNRVTLCNAFSFASRELREEGDNKSRFTHLTGLTRDKLLAPVPQTIFEDLDGLRLEQPNLREAIDRIEARLHAQFIGRDGAQLPPLLLVGPPGTGKTRLVKRVARALCLHTQEIPLAGAFDATVVSGLGGAWKNARPGMVIQTLADSPIANPLLIFDEVDKAGANSEWGNPLDRMLLLTEPETAREFQDDFLEIPVNTSYCSIIATANNADRLSAPLLSRFETVEVPPLNKEGRLRMIITAFNELRLESGYGRFLASRPDPDLARVLVSSELGGRELKLRLRYAMERACLEIPRESDSVETVRLAARHLPPQAQPRQRMGFL
jgi:ATP-dependent Lon protease